MKKVGKVRRDSLVQEFVESRCDKKFASFRAFVVGYEYVGTLGRVSKNEVASLSLGAEPRKVGRKVDKLVRKDCEEIVKTLALLA